MNLDELRRVLYKKEVTDGTGGTRTLVVTRESNGDAIFSLGTDPEIQLVGWSFEKNLAIEAVHFNDVACIPSARQNLLLQQSPGKSVEALRWVMFEKEIQGNRRMVVTNELNGSFLFLYTDGSDNPHVYGRYDDSASAIDALWKMIDGRY